MDECVNVSECVLVSGGDSVSVLSIQECVSVPECVLVSGGDSVNVLSYRSV